MSVETNAKARTLLGACSRLKRGAVVVEIGSVRFAEEVPSDGWSTVYLAEAAAKKGWEFHTVDVAAEASAIAARVAPGAVVHTEDGSVFLKSFKKNVDLLYLDGSADPGDATRQFAAARLSPTAKIVVDDVQPINGHGLGKGDALLPVLETAGWTVDIRETEPGYLMAVCSR